MRRWLCRVLSQRNRFQIPLSCLRSPSTRYIFRNSSVFTTVASPRKTDISQSSWLYLLRFRLPVHFQQIVRDFVYILPHKQ